VAKTSVGGGWLEDKDVALSSALLSGGVRGGVGNPAEEDEGSLTALLRDGFLSCTCCFCCTASSCLRSASQKQDVKLRPSTGCDESPNKQAGD